MLPIPFFLNRHLKISELTDLGQKSSIVVLGQVEDLNLKSISTPETFVEAGPFYSSWLIPTGIPISNPSTELVVSKLDFLRFCTRKCFGPNLDNWNNVWLNLPLDLVEAIEKKIIALVKFMVKESKFFFEKLEAKSKRKRKID